MHGGPSCAVEMRAAREYPDVGVVVMAQATSAVAMGVCVTLLDYDGIEGIVSLAELFGRSRSPFYRIFPMVWRTPLKVVRVDAVNGFVDLSMIRTSLDEAERCEAQHLAAKSIRNLAAGGRRRVTVRCFAEM